jgi:outer membrane lipase/esterase
MLLLKPPGRIMNRRLALCAAAFLPGMLASTSSMAEDFQELVAFGDSLSDNGNAGRFSNGPVWVEHLAESLGLTLGPSRLGGTNHAVGGALAAGGMNALGGQVRGYLAARRGAANPTALHTVWAGGNDLLAAIRAPDPIAPTRQAATAVGEAVATLVDAGARTLLVPNLPDIGMTPALRMAGAMVAAEGRQISQVYREALARSLDRVEGRSSVAILRLDVHALAERVLADPEAAGFSNVTDPCQGTRACDGYVFWDWIHPTAQAHARLATSALGLLGLVAPAEPG